MNGPKRTHDELGDLGQALLSAGRREQPDARALERTLAALAAVSVASAGSLVAGKATAGSAAAAAGSAGSAGSAAAGKATLSVAVAKWLGTGALFGGLIVGGSQAWQAMSTPEPASLSVPAPRAVTGTAVTRTAVTGTAVSSTAVTAPILTAPVVMALETERAVQDTGPERLPVAAPRRSDPGAQPSVRALPPRDGAAFESVGATPPSGAVPTEAVPVPLSSVAELGSAAGLASADRSSADRSSADRSSADRSSAAGPASAAPSKTDRLAEEVRYIDEARAQLAKGNTTEALRVLDEHRARFSRAALAPEALYLRMEALWASGRREAAVEVARRILQSSTNGPAVRRAQELVQ